MDVNTLTMEFSEPIDILSFTLNGILLQKSQALRQDQLDASVNYYAFTNSESDHVVFAGNDHNRTIVVHIDTTNMNNIKKVMITMLCIIIIVVMPCLHPSII